MGVLRHFCSIGLIVLAGLLCFFALDGCGNREGLSKLRPCRLPGIDEELLCGKFTVFENRQTRAGRNVIEIGLGEDLDYCAKIDRSTLVPRLGERVRMVAG